MYGLINQAIQDLIIQNYGEKSWEEIKHLAHVDIDDFVGMSTYPDSMTYQLIEATSQKLGLSQEEILLAFGEFWILFTAEKGYGSILDAAGDNLAEFLQNLNQLHSRIQTMMPELIPPRFECTDVTSQSLRFHYYSNRPGLSDLVMGILIGLGKRFKVNIKVDKEPSLPETKSTVFFISLESD
jgi:hypothetical protein